jgi:hypothetical protein
LGLEDLIFPFSARRRPSFHSKQDMLSFLLLTGRREPANPFRAFSFFHRFLLKFRRLRPILLVPDARCAFNKKAVIKIFQNQPGRKINEKAMDGCIGNRLRVGSRR